MNEINGQDEQSTSSEDIEEYEGEKNALIITTYETVRSYPALFLPLNVQYVILDEGQRIKNPQTLISKVVRRFDTGHRIMLTGAPVQNRLEELWSLVDFAYPGRLGTLQAFKSQFGIPITLGTKGGASPHLARIAVRCALALKQLIQRVLLRRVKRRVCKELPPKREEYLNSEDVQLAVEGAKGSVNNNNSYSNYSSNQNDAANKWNDKRKHRSSHYTAIGMLRKICNHPDLFFFHSPEEDKPEKYLFWKKSGKMIVLKQMLTKWFESHVRYKKWIEEEQKRLLEEENERLDDYYDDGINNNNNEQGIQKDKDIIEDIQNKDNINEQEQNKENIQVNKPIKNKKNKQPPLPHKVLLFCQTRQMLGAIEEMVNLLSLPYIRMDGTTPVNKRQQLVQQFNDIKNYNEFLFLLTTKVGGIGINLTGADRARERAWRLGQTRPVHIVRLISAGTIEERIYERQIFKEIVGAKVVKGADQSVDDAAEAQMTLPSNKSSSSSSSSSSSTNKIDQIKNSFIFGFGNSSKYLFQAPPPLYIQTNKKKYKEKLLRENNEQQEREINEKKDIMKGMKTRQKIVNNINQLQFDENGENQLIEIDGVQKKKIKDEENRKQLLSIAKEMKQQGILKDKQKELEQEKENDNNENDNELEEEQEQDEQDILSSFIVRAGTEEEEKE
ncbi:MAG: putative SNF2 family protein, partial [Streblomastix strix]